MKRFANIKDIIQRRILQKNGREPYQAACRYILPGYLQDKMDDLLACGIPPAAMEWLEEQFQAGSLTEEQFYSACQNAVYLIDIPYLLQKYRVSEIPDGQPKQYSYPAAFYGACFGDIAGSIYEGMYHADLRAGLSYDHCITKDSRPTDDTILSCATALAYHDAAEYLEARKADIIRPVSDPVVFNDFSPDTFRPFGKGNPYIDIYKECAKHPYENPSFGAHFIEWALSEQRAPYRSCGNGCASRIAPIIDLAEGQEEMILHATMSAAATHNHYDGVKGAILAATGGWMAHAGYSKNQIFSYIKKHYVNEKPLTLKPWFQLTDYTMQELRRIDGPTLCSFSVPAAAICFYYADCFEDVVTNVLSFDGDTDTIGAIACMIAGAYYGVPDDAIHTVDQIGHRKLGPLFDQARSCF